MNEFPVITIDGPAGSGKGTIAQRVANQLGWHILDSGALYRLVALAAMKRKMPLTSDALNEKALSDVAENLAVNFKIADEDGVIIQLEGENVTTDIRTEECACAASIVAAIPAVRKALLERQRKFLVAPGLIADGRDMGTVVFPDAKTKIYLTASAEIRAKRRLNQLKEQGINASLRGLICDIEERDDRDMNRQNAPLKPATDAVIIDTGSLTIEEVVSQVISALS